MTVIHNIDSVPNSTALKNAQASNLSVFPMLAIRLPLSRECKTQTTIGSQKFRICKKNYQITVRYSIAGERAISRNQSQITLIIESSQSSSQNCVREERECWLTKGCNNTEDGSKIDGQPSYYDPLSVLCPWSTDGRGLMLMLVGWCWCWRFRFLFHCRNFAFVVLYEWCTDHQSSRGI